MPLIESRINIPEREFVQAFLEHPRTAELSREQQEDYKNKIRRLLKEKNAVIEVEEQDASKMKEALDILKMTFIY